MARDITISDFRSCQALPSQVQIRHAGLSFKRVQQMLKVFIQANMQYRDVSASSLQTDDGVDVEVCLAIDLFV